MNFFKVMFTENILHVICDTRLHACTKHLQLYRVQKKRMMLNYEKSLKFIRKETPTEKQ